MLKKTDIVKLITIQNEKTLVKLKVFNFGCLNALVVLVNETTSLVDSVKYAKSYDGPEGPQFSSMVSCEVFSESDIVLGSVKPF